MNAHAQVINYQYDSLPVVELLSEFRKTSTDRKKIMRLLELDWPFALDVSRRASELLSGSLLAGNQRLVFHCLDQALNAYGRAALKPDHLRLVAFCETLINGVARAICSIRLSDQEGNSWTIEKRQPLSLWLREHAAEAIHIEVVAHEEQGERYRSAEEIIKSMVLSPTVREIIEDREQ
tara:strand:- start:2752 stop:3288 length:537 start_codon:yes stop_codon:yes gene_type:complete